MRQGDTETATSIIPSSCSSTEALGTSRPAAETPPSLPPPPSGQDLPELPPPQSNAPLEKGKEGKLSAPGWGKVCGRLGKGSTRAARPRSHRPRSSSRPLGCCSAQKERRVVDSPPPKKAARKLFTSAAAD